MVGCLLPHSHFLLAWATLRLSSPDEGSSVCRQPSSIAVAAGLSMFWNPLPPLALSDPGVEPLLHQHQSLHALLVSLNSAHMLQVSLHQTPLLPQLSACGCPPGPDHAGP